MKQADVVSNLRRLRGQTEARRKHFTQAQAVKGKLETEKVREQLDGLERDVLFLETLAVAIEEMPAIPSKDVLAHVLGGTEYRTVEVGS